MAYPLESYRPLLSDERKTQPTVVSEGEGSEDDSNNGENAGKVSSENARFGWSDHLFSVFGIPGRENAERLPR